MARKKRDPDLILRDLGKSVRDSRRAAELSQESVAFAASVSVRHYQKIEAGDTNPAFLALLAIADALNVRVSELLADLRS